MVDDNGRVHLLRLPDEVLARIIAHLGVELVFEGERRSSLLAVSQVRKSHCAARPFAHSCDSAQAGKGSWCNAAVWLSCHKS